MSDPNLDWQKSIRMPSDYEDRLERLIPGYGRSVSKVILGFVTIGLERAENLEKERAARLQGTAHSEDG